MKRVIGIIVCLIVLLLGVFGLVKNKNNKELKTEKILFAENNDYFAVIKDEEIIRTDEKLEKKEVVKKTETKKQETKKKNTTKKVSNKKSNTKKNTTIKYGTYGRLYVSSYNVTLYDYNVNTNSNKSLQAIVDTKDSAAYYENNNKLVIADHNYQGFNILVNLKIGTTSYIKFKDGKTIKYKLIKKAEGTNTGPDLIDSKGNSFFDMKSDIIMYTCYKKGVMVTLWSLA